MMRAERGVEPELVAFLKHPRIERTVPPEIRARALGAARAVVAAGGEAVAASPVSRPARPVAVPASAARGRARLRVALAASIAVAAAAVGATAALQSHRDQAPLASAGPPIPVAPPSARAANVARTLPEAPAVPAASDVPVKPTRPRRFVARVDPFAAELDLLQRAHGAYTRRDFSTALALVTEHAHRFPRGNLAEQREALRVRSLAGVGRRDDAHRAAAGFAHRFPRSVLLPQIEGSSESPEP